MRLQAWRTVGKNPSEDPPTTISIAPIEKMTGVFPWLLPFSHAESIFGEAIYKLGPEPQEVELTLAVKG